jgi:hypothetical protein
MFTFSRHGRTFRCWVDMEGRTAGGLARPSGAVWVVEVDGAIHVPFDANPEDAPGDVERRVLDWYDHRTETP